MYDDYIAQCQQRGIKVTIIDAEAPMEVLEPIYDDLIEQIRKRAAKVVSLNPPQFNYYNRSLLISPIFTKRSLDNPIFNQKALSPFFPSIYS